MQAGLSLCCLQTLKDRFPRIEASIIVDDMVYSFCYSVSTIGVLAEQNLLYRYIANGDMIWELPTYFEVSCDMDLKFFPFDKQTCGITMSSWSFDASEISLKMLDNTVNLALYK